MCKRYAKFPGGSARVGLYSVGMIQPDVLYWTPLIKEFPLKKVEKLSLRSRSGNLKISTR